ncbi:MAG: ATP synthase F0 subunit B [Proteobacteria bacterium]|nr:ATP synthase F0 subunit B [Pseudomonadota bacterium]
MKLPFVSRNRFAGLVIVIMAGLLFLTVPAFCSSGGEGGGTKGWINTDTYRVMNFAVLAIGLIILLRKPASNALNDRIKGIREQLNDLETKKLEAEKNLAQYNERLSLLDKEAEKIVVEYIKQGNEAKKRILDAAGDAALKLEEQARRNIEHEFKLARSKLKEEVVEKALVMAEEIIKRNITGKDQEILVSEYLEKVVA